jgi:hypothetical protein
MVTALALLTLTLPLARAQALSVGPTFSVVGVQGAGLHPGLRIGYEPSPAASFELQGDSSFDGRWDAGLGLAGRLWMVEDDGAGIYGLGRFAAGLAGRDAALGPWTWLAIGFGGRPVPLLDLAVAVGPEWALTDGGRWRSELSLSFVLGPDTLGGGAGSGKVRHRPRAVPQ